MEISVIYPAYNEAGNIERTIRRSVEALRSLFDRFEIIIVDDASADETGEIAESLAAEHPEIKVIHNAANQGQGESLRIGFREASYDLVIHNAMDYPFDLKDLSKMLPLLDEADIVVAVRNRRTDYTLYRRFLSVMNLILLNLLFGLGLRDYNFVQLYRKKVLETVQVDARSTAFLTPETLIRAHDLGYRIKEVEIDYHPRERGVATSGRPRVLVSSLRDLLRFWLKRTLMRGE
jgi:glycosyltransferase involved in cell wall biosynthesis